MAVKKQPGNKPMAPELKVLYNNKIAGELKKELGLKNINQAPRLEKIVINSGLGRAKDEKRVMEAATNSLRKITGQQPVQTTAKKSVAGFKLREGNKIGLKVTLRDERMYDFLYRLVNIVLPRLRDFHGVSAKSFDKSGNYALGMVDQSAFPELSYEETTTTHGLQFIFVIRSINPGHSKLLLEKLGLPYEKSTRSR